MRIAIGYFPLGLRSYPKTLYMQKNGGLTLTQALLTGSPAIDAGENTTCPAVDQRGVDRPYNSTGLGSAMCDIGAYEAAADVIQTIQFGTPPAEKFSSLPLVITAAASSGLPVVFSVNTPTVCAVSTGTLFAGITSATVTLINIGTCRLLLQQPGNSTFIAAAPVSQSFYVTGDLFLPLVIQ